MRWNRFQTARLLLCLMLLIAGSAWGQCGCGLRLQTKEGPPIDAPALGTTVEVRVTGIVARAKVTQIFQNPSQEWVTGVYLFPLPDGAAVDTLRLTVGDRQMEGVVQTKEEAKQTLAAAEQEGRKASLVEQLRPGLYTTTVANVGPGEMVEVEIEMQQVVAWERGRFVLRFPMLAPPRYTPPVRKKVADEQEIPNPPVSARKINPFSFHVDLSPGFPIAAVASSTHQVTVAQDKKRLRWAVDLAAGIAPADGDFILEWAPAVGREPRAVYFVEEVDGEQYSLLMMMPPDDGAAVADRLPRETVFVIDTSGSMSGTALEQAKQALLQGIARLQPGDWFNVMRFSSQASALFNTSVPVGPDTLETARKYVEALQVDGGTEILGAFRLALRGGRPGLVQQVIFATDGQVMNEAETLGELPRLVGNHRLFTVAIGPAANAGFLRRAAEIGRGSLTRIAHLGEVSASMAELFSRLESPMLHNIDVQWSDPAAEAWPAQVPDLYLGEPLVVSARSGEAGAVSVSGLRNGSAWQDELPAPAVVKSAGLDKLWAGRKVQSLMDSLQIAGSSVDPEEIRREVTELGLRHHLVTNWTSLVAVDVEVTAPAGVQPQRALVPVNAPRGSGISDTISVTAESPLLDVRRISTGATVNQTELEKIPSARDPWAVLQTSPGILSDRVNVGGNESGQQSAYVLGGSTQGQNSFVVDGVVITDMAAMGAAPSYFDFDAFEEMQVDTGGADVTLETAGARLTTVRPRGTNLWRASLRVEDSEGSLLVGEENEARLDSLRTVDVETGGPIVRDRLWVWGEAGRDEIGRLALGGQREELQRTSGSLRVNAQVTESLSASLSASGGDADGSGIGAGPGRTFGTTWDETGRERLGSVDVTKIFGSNFFLTLTAAGSDRDRRDVPYETGDAVVDAEGIARGGWFGLGEEQRIREARLAGSVFFDSGSRNQVSHELLLGSGWREQDESRSLGAPGRVEIAGRGFGLDDVPVTEIWRGGVSDARITTSSAWVQDNLTFGDITATLGARLDRHDLGIESKPWTLAPRLGLSWTIGPERQTVLKTSLGRFASRIGSRAAWHLDPDSPALVRFLGDSSIPWTWEGIDPLHPGVDPDAVDPDLRPEITDEAVLGVEHAIRPDVLFGLRATWRRTGDLLDERRLVRDTATGQVFAATAGDWVPAGRLTGTLPDGTAYDAPVHDLRPGLVWTGGTLLTNGDRRRDDLGLTLYWQKRLAHRWMSRGHLTWQDGDQRLGRGFRLFDDPTNTLGGDDDEGRPVTVADSFRPHEDPRFLGSGWSFSVSGLRQIGGSGFSIGAAVNGRQGSLLPWYRLASRERAGVVPVQLTSRPDSERTPDVVTVDTRLEQEIPLRETLLTLSLEAYNLLGQRTVHGRELDLGIGRGGSAEAVIAPRTFRLGVRLGWG